MRSIRGKSYSAWTRETNPAVFPPGYGGGTRGSQREGIGLHKNQEERKSKAKQGPSERGVGESLVVSTAHGVRNQSTIK